MKASDIDQVLLVGGSSRIPKVQQILQEMFPQTELARRINPDEAIAVGGEFWRKKKSSTHIRSRDYIKGTGLENILGHWLTTRRFLELPLAVDSEKVL